MIVFLYGLVYVGMPLSSLNDISFRDIYSSSIDVIVAIRKPLHLLPRRGGGGGGEKKKMALKKME